MSNNQETQAARVFRNVFGGSGIQQNVTRLARSFAEGSSKGPAGDAMGCTWSGLAALYDSLNSGQEMCMKDRRFRVLRTLGEGGYAFVYLVKEVSPRGLSAAAEEGTYALKKFLIQTKEQLQLVNQEVESVSRFKHPNLLPLLDYAIVSGAEKSSKEAYLLFPVYPEGTLQDHIMWLTQKDPPPSHPERLSAYAVLEMTRQIASGLSYMHSLDPPYAHNDLKPGNVLISSKGKEESGISLAIMDFGSVRPARRQIRTRGAALELQEWAAQHCSAAFRAPELWDTPSNCDVDERSDIWSLGCTVFALMYGQSPFEFSLGEAGGSLQLAVMSGTIKWPPPARPPYPDSLHELVSWMVTSDASKRPSAKAVVERVEGLLAKLPPSM